MRAIASWIAFLAFCLIGLAVAQLSSASKAQTAPVANKPAEQQVIIGAYINDIQSVNLANNTHLQDFYLWFRWQQKDQNPAKGIDFMNAASSVDHTNVILNDPPKQQPDGSFYTVIHHQGAFSSKLPLQNYPFDRQVLNIEIEDAAMTADEREFVVDKNALSMLDPVIHLPGYEIGEPRLFVTRNVYSTNFGDLSTTGANAYSRATIEIPIRRPWVSGVFKVMLPILLILISAVLGLAVKPDHIDARIGLGITALLTMVALQFTASATLPEVSYLMLIDKVYIASYLVIVTVLALVVRDSWHSDAGGHDRVIRRNRRAIAVLVASYLLFVGYLVAMAMLS